MSLASLRNLALAVATAAAVASAPVAAQDAPAVTVSSLLMEGYVVVSSLMTPIGAAVFMQALGQPKLYFCVLRETPDDEPITTLYCKPVE